MRRAGISNSSIEVVREAFRLIYRRNRPLHKVQEYFTEQLQGVMPMELSLLLTFIENQRNGKLGRAREAVQKSARRRIHLSYFRRAQAA